MASFERGHAGVLAKKCPTHPPCSGSALMDGDGRIKGKVAPVKYRTHPPLKLVNGLLIGSRPMSTRLRGELTEG